MPMKSIRILFFVFVLTSSNVAFGQKYILPNEVIIFSFETNNGKKVSICKDKLDKYIIYRFGNKQKIEFEFPNGTKDKTSFKNFKYSFWLRGGGVQNDGIDLNYLYFTNENYRYVIYQTYSARDNKSNVGIKITDLNTQKIIDIKGKIKSIKGTLIDFRFNNLIEIGDELFE